MAKAPKPPKGYGKLLQQHREALGLSRPEFAAKSGIDAVKIPRNETGMDERSVKGSNEIRDALVKLGREVPPVPVGDDATWEVPAPATRRLEGVEENVRRNLVATREQLGLDQFAAAHATGISYEDIRAFELGEQSPSTGVLARFAKAYGCQPGAFLDEKTPTVDPEAVTGFWYGGPNTRFMTPEQHETIEGIMASVRERARIAKKKVEPKKKRR